MFFNKKEQPIIISVGGSLIVPEGNIDTEFLKNLNRLIRDYVKEGKRFFLITGGGKIMRFYRDAARSVVKDVSNEDLDWLAIHVTRLNGHLLRTIFEDIAHPRIIEHYEHKLRNLKEPVVIGAGWKPGWSTDYDAVILARDYHARYIINLSNVHWVYNKDPNKYPDAQIIKKTTWEEMEKIVGDKWTPGLNSPFDPIATKLAKKLGLTVIITHGHDFNNLKKIIDNDDFEGTVVTPYKIDVSFYDRDYYTTSKAGYRLGGTESFIGRIFQSIICFYRALIIKFSLNPKNCLDVGCGTGRLVRWLRFFGIDAHGVEISKTALGLADKKVKPFLKIGDIVNLPYQANKFDLVLTFDVFEHIERSKIKKAVEETIRVSKKYVLHKIYTFENNWIRLFHVNDYSHISVLPKKSWQEIFSTFKNVFILRGSFFKLPEFFETIFLLRKK